jgi:hypothetical protein
MTSTSKKGSGRSQCTPSKTSRHPALALACCVGDWASKVKRVSDGLDPMNVMRDEQLNRKIPTNAWNTIVSPAEASMLRAEEV